MDFENYDEYRIPPNPKLTENYQKSTKFGKVKEKNSERNVASNLPIDNTYFDINSKTSEFSENGHGYTLFFKISKFSIYGLLVSIVPLAIGLMILFHTGNDCEGETVNNNTPPKKPLFNSTESHRARNQIERYAKLHNFEIDLNPLDDIFEDRDGDGLEVSEVFGQTIEFFSGNYLRRFFIYVCRDEDNTIQRNLKPEFREFCMKYYFDLCDQTPESSGCMKRAIDFYNEKLVHFSCAKTWINKISLSNRIEKIDRTRLADKILPYIYQVIFYVMIIGTLAFQWWHDKYRIKLKEDSQEINDISLMLDKLPFGEKYTGVNLKEKIFEVFESHGYKLMDINFAFDIEEFIKLKEEYKDLRREYEKKKYKANLTQINMSVDDQTSEKEDLIDKNYKKMKELEEKILKLENDFEEEKIELMIGKAFIMFASTDERNECFERFKVDGFWHNFIDTCFSKIKKDRLILKDIKGEDIRIQVEDSYEPQDIIWESLKYGYIHKFIRERISSLIGYVVVIIGFFGLYYMKTNQVIS